MVQFVKNSRQFMKKAFAPRASDYYLPNLTKLTSVAINFQHKRTTFVTWVKIVRVGKSFWNFKFRLFRHFLGHIQSVKYKLYYFFANCYTYTFFIAICSTIL